MAHHGEAQPAKTNNAPSSHPDPGQAAAVEGDELPEECSEPNKGPSSPFPIVGVGASAGGLEAFRRLLSALPVDTGMAFVLVQHLAATHPSALADILSRATTMSVLEVKDQTPVEPNCVYVIPPGQSMVISQGRLRLHPRPESGQHRPIDQFFCALAEDQGFQAIGVVLSGTATDGTLGLEAIKGEGGITFAQDDTARQEGMPHSAIASGCVDFVLPPDEIALEIAWISRHPFTAPPASAEAPKKDGNFKRIVDLLRRATGVDFSLYKPNTIRRRVTRRMILQKLEGLAEYIQLLQGSPAEVEALYQDVLINVTSFFRDPDSFEVLKTSVFPRLVKSLNPGDPLRVWTLGCSTGQEAYSVAMAFAEFAEATGNTTPLQVFATDVNAKTIEKARAGLYPKDIDRELSPERLRRFFIEVDGQYRITKGIRDACIFAHHNVLTNPPFSRMDLITCRNVLIYMEPVLQQRILPAFHYALKPAGVLWLGTSETVGRHLNLFQADDAKHKIYVKKPGSLTTHFTLQPGGMSRSDVTSNTVLPRIESGLDLHREADRILLGKFGPPSVLVSADLEILQFRGQTGPYLAPAPGKASFHLLKMLREDLVVTVRAAVLRARKDKASVREEGLRVKSNGGDHEVAIEVIPIQAGQGGDGGGFLILFEASAQAAGPQSALSEPRAVRDQADEPAERQGLVEENARLVQELTATREFLQSIIEQQEAANEELQSAHEEVQSSNEELQSINEELETSKEEIQSSNEELVTINDELNSRNLELFRVNNDFLNLLGSVQLAIVILGPDFRVRRFTPPAEKLFRLKSTDVGRPLGDIRQDYDLPDLTPLLTEVFDTTRAKEFDVQDKAGHWYSLRLRPYRTLDNKIDGVVMMLVDVDALKRAQALTASIVATVREPLLVLDKDLRVLTASRSFYESFRVTPEVTENRSLYELGDGQWDIPELRKLLGEMLPQNVSVSDYRVRYDFEHIGPKTMLLNARRLIQADEQNPLILLAIEDITQSDSLTTALRQSEQRFRALFELGPVAVYTCDLSGTIQEFNRRAAELWGREPQPGDTGERFCGSFKMHLPDGTFMPHDQCPMAEVLSGAIPAAHDAEVVIERPDGSRVNVIVNIVPFTNDKGEITGAVNCFYDITERKQAEAELRNADRRKDEFLAMLAHELRGPLAPLSNTLEIMKRSTGEAELLQKLGETMARQLSQMTRLIDDLLDVSRIRQGKLRLRLTDVELASVVYQAVEACRPIAEHSEQQLAVTLPSEQIYLHGDPVRLAQVFGNLLNNACKYTERKGQITLTARRQGGEVVVSVKDTGIGISPDMLSTIFTMFSQVDQSLERSQGGLGIGLTLVKWLVEMHGGSVDAFSEGPGKGSEFVVHLPILIEPPNLRQRPEPTERGDATPKARRILVVDDNRDSANSLAMLLKITGHETRTAHDGLDAVEAAATFLPDVVLLDLGLPKLNGYEVCRKIREQESDQKIMLIALTGWGQDEDRRKSREAGFDSHLVKPVVHAELMKLLDEFQPTPV